MVDRAVQQGIDVLVATPHARPGFRKFNRALLEERLARIRQYCAHKGYAIRIVGGAEILHSDAAIRLLDAGELPVIGNSRFVLVEWMPDTSIEEIRTAARAYSNAGYRVILAHTERYRRLWHCYREMEHLKQAFDMRIQVNCNVFLDRLPWGTRRFVQGMMKRELIDYVASDAHATTGRCIQMAEAYQAMEQAYGRAVAERLTGENQREFV